MRESTPGYRGRMDGHPVLRQLAIVRAARDFGLPAAEVEALTPCTRPTPRSVDALAAALADALLAERA